MILNDTALVSSYSNKSDQVAHFMQKLHAPDLKKRVSHLLIEVIYIYKDIRM